MLVFVSATVADTYCNTVGVVDWPILGLVVVIGLAALLWARSLAHARRAQQAAVERITQLQAITVALSEVLHPRDAAAVIVDESVRVLEADAGVVAVVDESGDELEILGNQGFLPQQLEAWRRFPRDAPVPIAEVVQRREPVFLQDVSSSGRGHEWTLLGALPGVRAIAAVPLLLRSRCLGVLGLSFARPRAFNDQDRAFVQALAHQGAQALERARLHEAADRARAAAEAASRAKDDFLATLSHELRTPLNAILGWAQMLRAGRVEPEVVPRALEAIEQNARAQARLVKDLLDVSQMVGGGLQHARELIDLSACLDAALGTVRPTADGKRLTLTVRRADREARVRGDAARLQQVFWNLLANAIKFTRPGGRIDVALSYTGDEAVFRVTDSGDGLNPERLQVIFERFYQVDSSRSRAHGGLGLGLAIVRHLVEAHEGSVTAMSAGEGRGSTFLVRLPLERGPASADAITAKS